MEIPIIQDLIIILALSVLVILLTRRLNVPSILGFLLTGILAGPHGFHLIEQTHEVEILAEIGVILLLFTIGIEFSFKTLRDISRTLLIGGFFQVLVTIGATTFFAYQLDFSLAESIFLGFLVSLSSTAVVLKLIQERGEVSSPHGRNALGIFLFSRPDYCTHDHAYTYAFGRNSIIRTGFFNYSFEGGSSDQHFNFCIPIPRSQTFKSHRPHSKP